MANEKLNNSKSSGTIEKQLNSLREKLECLSEKVKKNQNDQKEFTPNVFNDLQPYTEIPDFFLRKNHEKDNGFLLRNTATDLCDPWIDLKYDMNIMTDKVVLNSPKESNEDKKSPKPKSLNNVKEGSTRFPKYYSSDLEEPPLWKKELFFIDVPMIRKVMKEYLNVSTNDKIDFEYNRTKKDFYRMGLDKLDEMKTRNREYLKMVYCAYLQNNAGSTKALKECMKEMDEQEEKTC